MVLPNHRGGGLGHQLYRRRHNVPTLVTLTMAEATRKMGERLGAITLGEVHQLTRSVRPDPATVRRYLMVRTRFTPGRGDAGPRVPGRTISPAAATGGQSAAPAARPDQADTADVRRDENRRSRRRSATGSTTCGAGPDRTMVIFPRDTRFLDSRFVECRSRVPAIRSLARWRTIGYLVLRDAEPVEPPRDTSSTCTRRAATRPRSRI